MKVSSPCHAPEFAEDDHWLSLGLKVAGAMFLADLVARSSGFDDPTWAVISAAYLATSPPFASFPAVLLKIVALVVGIGGVLGVAEKPVAIAWERPAVQATQDGFVLVRDLDRFFIDAAPP